MVLQVGAIDFFNKKAKAIKERIRAVKPVTTIYSGDETLKQSDRLAT